MECIPWVNRVWGYMRYPRHATLRENFQFVTALRREKFDVLINLNGSDRSSWLTFLSGARERLGRIPGGGGAPFWRQRSPPRLAPLWRRAALLAALPLPCQGGLPVHATGISCRNQAGALAAAGLSPGDAGSVLPFQPVHNGRPQRACPGTNFDLIKSLERRWPEKRLVLSCAPNERERKNWMPSCLVCRASPGGYLPAN